MCLIHDNVMLAALFELGRHRQFSVERLACFLAAARRERRILDRSDEGGDRPTCRGAFANFSGSQPLQTKKPQTKVFAIIQSKRAGDL